MVTTNVAKRNTVLMIIVILCTITIVWTNYMFTQNMVADFNKVLMEKEYNKIWGKENYIILQELQKREILWYIDKVKKEQPELIDEILKKQESDIKDLEYNVLSDNIAADLKSNSFALWNTWALVSIIEFSDLECPFCIEWHKAWAHKKAMEEYWENLNYIFKNFPLPSHKNAWLEAAAAKCVEKIAWGEKYIEYIDSIFDTTKWGWEWFSINSLAPLAEQMWVNTEEFNSCFNNKETVGKVEKEFKQWVMLKINSVPTTLVLNNQTWKYITLPWVTQYEKLKEVIDFLSK